MQWTMVSVTETESQGKSHYTTYSHTELQYMYIPVYRVGDFSALLCRVGVYTENF